MAKPLYSVQDTDILNAFDQQAVCTIKNVVDHLNGSHKYQAVRRGILRLVKTGVLIEINGDKTHNQKYYTKNIFAINSTRFVDFEGNNVSLKAFVHGVTKLGDTEESKLVSQLLSPVALDAIKHWILNGLAASDPEAYTSKNLATPNTEEYYRKLDGVLETLSKLHAFLKTYRLTPVDTTKLAAEFKAVAIEELISIVDRTWENNG